MSRIDELITALCPDGVEYRRLGELGEFIRGRRFTKADYVPSGLGSIHYGEIYTSYGSTAASVLKFVRPELASRLRLARYGDLVIAATGENVQEVCKAVAWLGDAEVAIHDDCFIYRHGLDPTFVAYFFQTAEFHEQKIRMTSESKLVRVSAANLARVVVPTPPIAVQREIVRILNSFSALDAELEAELEARRCQFEHYRDSLLTFTPDEVRWSDFGDVATIVRGGSPRPIQAFFTESDDGINWIKIGDVSPAGKYITGTSQRIKPEGAARSRTVAPGDFVLSNSMSFGRPYIVQIDGCIHDGWLAIKDFDDAYLPDFLYHLLRSGPVYREMSMRASSGTVQNLNAEIVKSLTLPVPSLETQQELVDVLDSFDSLVNDITVGLPAEIAARRRQYGYYRDKLLTFDKAV
ncbi:restriction endonuclease subunit S [Aeromicrobium sp. P5_D10]